MQKTKTEVRGEVSKLCKNQNWLQTVNRDKAGSIISPNRLMNQGKPPLYMQRRETASLEHRHFAPVRTREQTGSNPSAFAYATKRNQL